MLQGIGSHLPSGLATPPKEEKEVEQIENILRERDEEYIRHAANDPWQVSEPSIEHDESSQYRGSSDMMAADELFETLKIAPESVYDSRWVAALCSSSSARRTAILDGRSLRASNTSPTDHIQTLKLNLTRHQPCRSLFPHIRTTERLIHGS